MLNCYFNHMGYAIEADGTTIVRAVEPKCEEDGTPSLDTLQHTYLVLFTMLGELVGVDLGYAEVRVHNDTRIIDEMDGSPSIDEMCMETRRSIWQQLLPKIDGRVTWQKISSAKLDERILEHHRAMLGDRPTAKRVAELNRLDSLAARRDQLRGLRNGSS